MEEDSHSQSQYSLTTVGNTTMNTTLGEPSYFDGVGNDDDNYDGGGSDAEFPQGGIEPQFSEFFWEGGSGGGEGERGQSSSKRTKKRPSSKMSSSSRPASSRPTSSKPKPSKPASSRPSSRPSSKKKTSRKEKGKKRPLPPPPPSPSSSSGSSSPNESNNEEQEDDDDDYGRDSLLNSLDNDFEPDDVPKEIDFAYELLKESVGEYVRTTENVQDIEKVLLKEVLKGVRSSNSQLHTPLNMHRHLKRLQSALGKRVNKTQLEYHRMKKEKGEVERECREIEGKIRGIEERRREKENCEGYLKVIRDIADGKGKDI